MGLSKSESNIVVSIMAGCAILGAFLVLSKVTDIFGPMKRQFLAIFGSTAFWIVLGILLGLSVVVGILNIFKTRRRRQRWRRKKQPHITNVDFMDATDDNDLKLHMFKWLRPSEIQAYIERVVTQEPVDVVKLVDFLLVQAAGQRSSDIHIEPGESKVTIKFRIDGVIQEIAEFDKRIHARLVSRLRILSDLAIYEKGVPQDGRLQTTIMGNSYEVRISIMPTLHGEKTVIRLFEIGELRFTLSNTGMDEETLWKFRRIITASQGIVFFTGPTGSGKTTTIYAALKEIYESRGGSVNIVTIEDPIEYDMQHFNQSQVNTARGLTFAKGLRTLLRQDPDVIMVGEIRDAETAEIAIRAGLTGHLVLTTIHADSAAGVFNRLIEMKVEPFLLASATTAIMAQRLVRKLCVNCRDESIPDLSVLDHLKIPADRPMHFFQASGCQQCMQRGYYGRIGLFELLVVDDAIRSVLLQKSTTFDIHKTALKNGMKTLLEDGLQKVNDGLTSLEEIQRITV